MIVDYVRSVLNVIQFDGIIVFGEGCQQVRSSWTPFKLGDESRLWIECDQRFLVDTSVPDINVLLNEIKNNIEGKS